LIFFEPCKKKISKSVCKIAWLSIGLSSWRFRKAWIAQGRSVDEMKFRASWTWPWGPPFVVCLAKLYTSYIFDTESYAGWCSLHAYSW
jgi:amino acid permease